MVLNALATGSIVFRIVKVFRAVKDNTTSEEKFLGVTGGTKLCSIIFIIIESGMALFAIQLARVINTTVNVLTEAKFDAYDNIVGAHEIINVIISLDIITFMFH